MFFDHKEKQEKLQAVEHLKAYVSTVLDAFHKGSGLEGAPITLEIAKLLIWKQVQAAFEGERPDGVLFVRVAAARRSSIIGFLDQTYIISVRCLGPRGEGDQHVAYCWLEARDLKAVFTLADENECTIRDWEIYP